MLSLVPDPSPALRPHQVAAIDAVVKKLTDQDRGQVRMACGTGKTLTAIRLAERLDAEQILVLLPNLSLLAQTMREWQRHSVRPFRAVAVCSDSSVADENVADENTVSLAELRVPVTTNPDLLAAHLAGGPRRTVVFGTYHSADVLAAAQSAGAPAFDLVLADEAHRTAGHADGPFRLVLDAAQIRGARRVFMTATARTDGGKGGRSMDDESLYGPVLFDYTFRQALDAGLLCSYRVVIVGITDKMIRPYLNKGAEVVVGRARLTGADAAAAVAVLKAMDDYGLRRMVSFHSTVKGAADFASALPAVARWMSPQHADGLRTGHVNGQMSSTERATELDHLRDLGPDERMVLTNARCLTEGVDVPAIDAVAFIDPKSSYIDVVQAAGRALRLAPGKDVGTILLAVYVGDGEDADQAVASSRFADIRTVLQVLLDHDPNFAAALAAPPAVGRSYAHVGNAPAGHSSEEPAPRLQLGAQDAEWDDLGAAERTETRASGGQGGVTVVWDMPEGSAGFHRALCTRLLTRATDGFQERMTQVRAYIDANGKLPSQNAQRDLGTWLYRQRHRHRDGSLSKQQIALLESLPGWSWQPRRISPAARARISELAAAGMRPSDIAAQLTAEGMPTAAGGPAWERRSVENLIPGANQSAVSSDNRWLAQYTKLKQHSDTHGRLRRRNPGVPLQLSYWMNRQKTRYSEGKLSAERAALLEALPGWLWPTRGIDAEAA